MLSFELEHLVRARLSGDAPDAALRVTIEDVRRRSKSIENSVAQQRQGLLAEPDADARRLLSNALTIDALARLADALRGWADHADAELDVVAPLDDDAIRRHVHAVVEARVSGARLDALKSVLDALADRAEVSPTRPSRARTKRS